MRLLLASAGITNASIRRALVDLLGKPIVESTALCIPTASYGMRNGGAAAAYLPSTQSDGSRPSGRRMSCS